MLVEIKKINKEERPVVSSLDVARTFGKRHDHVVRDIRALLAVEDFNIPNFGEVNQSKIGPVNGEDCSDVAKFNALNADCLSS